MNSARSRTSMNCTGSFRRPGRALHHRGQALRPVRKAVGRVAGTDDVRRTHDHAMVAERACTTCSHFAFATPNAADSSFGSSASSACRSRFVEAALQVRVVHAGRRSEQVAADVSLQQRRRLTHPVRIGRGVVHDGIPLLPLQRLQVSVPVTRQSLTSAGRSACRRPRVKIVTRWPRETAWRTRCGPMNPVPPSTSRSSFTPASRSWLEAVLRLLRADHLRRRLWHRRQSWQLSVTHGDLAWRGILSFKPDLAMVI